MELVSVFSGWLRVASPSQDPSHLLTLTRPGKPGGALIARKSNPPDRFLRGVSPSAASECLSRHMSSFGENYLQVA